MMKTVVLGVAMVLALVSTAEAKKKPFSVAGCTAAILQKVVQTPAGAECGRRQDEAFLKGTAPVLFVCLADGSVACCTDGPSPTCTQITRTRNSSILDSLGGGTLEMSQ
jgi:hypothetical protein